MVLIRPIGADLVQSPACGLNPTKYKIIKYVLKQRATGTLIDAPFSDRPFSLLRAIPQFLKLRPFSSPLRNSPNPTNPPNPISAQMPSDQLDHSSSTSTAASDNQQQPQTMSKPTPKIISLILRGVIMSLLTSIFFLFVGIAAIFLIHLFLAGRHLRRRRQSQFPSDFPTRGMSLSDLHHLPRFRFGEGSQLDSGSECVICLDKLRHGDLFRILPGCSHPFHLDCIDTWLVKAAACPICRTRVVIAGLEIGASSGDEFKQIWTVRA
ncbi:hypothetical protein QQ045_000614 [Rhodiola kirilowii]